MRTDLEQTPQTNELRISTPRQCKAAVFERPNAGLVIRDIPIPTVLEPDAVLCKVRMSTLCGSDLHTVFGRRCEPAPSILGHEIVGEIVEHPKKDFRDFNGVPLSKGDRITWSIMASCRQCWYCQAGLPQKCVQVRKYGHLPLDEHPHITGGYAEYICLMPGTALFKVPDDLSDEMVAPANCTLATAQNAVATVRLSSHDTVLVQGAGLLGLYLCALAKSKGCPAVIATDLDPSRLQMARQFGADHCFAVHDYKPTELIRRIREACPEGRLSVSFEACGATEAADIAMEALDVAGRYLLAGLVTPNSLLHIDANQVIRKVLTIAGVHNYGPDHLQGALEFLQAHHAVYPFDAVVGKVFPLARINDAIQEAVSGRYPRVGIRP